MLDTRASWPIIRRSPAISWAAVTERGFRAFALLDFFWKAKEMRPGMFSPNELQQLDDVLRKAAAELGYSAGTGEYEDLASSLISLFQTIKDPAELLMLAVRSARLTRQL